MTSASSDAVFRIDAFAVPAAALSPFLERVRLTQAALDALPGCKQNLVLTRSGGNGDFNLVTIVEWSDAESMANAKAHMQARYAEEGFDPANFMQSLGIRPDFGLYQAV